LGIGNLTVSFFQTYLITGNKDQRRHQTKTVAKNFGINLQKNSPDIFIIKAQKDSISIDEIRELKRHIFQKPLSYKFKFIIIEEAEKLTIEAQNALLKILEEPPASAIIILEARNKSQLLPTIQSRVVTFSTVPDRKIQQENLDILSEKNLLLALEKIAQIEKPLSWLDRQMLFCYKSLTYKIFQRKFQSDNQSQVDFEKLVFALEKFFETKKQIEANVNPKLALFNLIFSLNA